MGVRCLQHFKFPYSAQMFANFANFARGFAFLLGVKPLWSVFSHFARFFPVFSVFPIFLGVSRFLAVLNFA
jgi:hypothetical protein